MRVEDIREAATALERGRRIYLSDESVAVAVDALWAYADLLEAGAAGEEE